MLFSVPCCARQGPHHAEPVPRDSQRTVVAPVDLAVVTPDGDAGPLPALAEPGSHGRGSVVMLIRFPTPWGNQAEIAGAFLLLGLQDAAQPDGRAVRVEVARILDPWVGSDVSWGRLPRLSPVEITTSAPVSSAAPLRIDVTHIVRRWTKGKSDDRGIALLVCANGPFSPGYATGASGGLAPRLDVYVR